MVNGKFLSEVVSKEQFHKGKFNLVIAKTGQGKTTMALHTLPTLLEIEDKSRILFLIDTNMGRDYILSEKDTQSWGEKQNKIYVMNYHKFGSLFKEHKIWAAMFDLVIADEFHNLYKYARIDEAKMYHNNPTFSPETISMMLSLESPAYKAMEMLKIWAAASNTYVVAMTATPQQFLDKDKELTEYINKIQYNETLIAYEVLEKYYYTDVSLLLRQNPENKRLIYVPTITQGKDFKTQIENNTDRKVVSLWAASNLDNPLSEEQLQTRQYLIENHSFPEPVDDIICTEAYSTGWTLQDDRVKEQICHSGNKIIQEQFQGRARQDIEKLYVYDSEAAKNTQKAEKRKTKRKEQVTEIEVPKEYLDRKLKKKERDELIQKIGYDKKWVSLKKALEKSYNIITDSHGNVIISFQK